MGSGSTRGFAFIALIAGCNFSASLSPNIDAPDVDAPDGAPLTPYWVVAAMARGSASTTPRIQALPFDGTRFTTPCVERAAPGFSRDLLHHPTLRLLYSVDTGFHALDPGCNAMTFTGTPNISGARPIQQIAQDPATGIGFFTMDGAGALGVYRFTSAGDGTPTVTGSANATSNAGPIALDAPNRALFVAGPVIAGGYALVGPTLDLPATYTSAAMCMEPVRLILTSTNYLLAFCADTTEIRRYTRSPFASDTMVGALGMVDSVVPLPGDRAIAARKAPNSDLVVVSLNGGSPSWGVGPPVSSRVIAMAASRDGRVVATAHVDPLDVFKSGIAIWSVNNNVVTLLDVAALDTVVTALAVTTPGS